MASIFKHRGAGWFTATSLCLAASSSACGKGPPAESPDTAREAEPSTGGPGAECIASANGKRDKRADEPIRIGLRHILVRHADAKRADGMLRTREQACLRPLEALRKLESSGDWDAVAAEYSDEKGAAARHGSLGDLTRDDVDPDFADAAFELDVDQLSYVVESESGFHVILRTN
jgi:hypothetical protein